MSQPDREQAVSRAFVALADTLVDDYDIIDLLDQLVAYSMDLLAADAAGILLGDTHRQLRVVAASSEDAELMELLQLQNEQGPCLDCYHTGAPVSVPDLADATTSGPPSPPRWRKPARSGRCTRSRCGYAVRQSVR